MLFKLIYASPFRPDGDFAIRLIPDLPETERPACLSQRRVQWDLFLQLFYTGNLVKQLIYRGKIPILISIKARRVYR